MRIGIKLLPRCLGFELGDFLRSFALGTVGVECTYI